MQTVALRLALASLLTPLLTRCVSDDSTYSQDPTQPWPPNQVGLEVFVNPRSITDPNLTNAPAYAPEPKT